MAMKSTFFLLSISLFLCCHCFRFGIFPRCRIISQLSLSCQDSVNPASVKELRDLSGAGFLDCKKALAECNGDIKNAIDLLRKQGVIQAAKKSHRATSSGVIGCKISEDKKRGCLVEINTETDFVAKNVIYTNLVASVASTIVNNLMDSKNHTVADVNEMTTESGIRISDLIVDAIAKTGENIVFQRVYQLVAPSSGFISSYVHAGSTENQGTIGVLVGIKCDDIESDDIIQFGKNLGMHIAAQNPDCLNIDDVDPDAIRREKEVIRHQIEQAGKPSQFLDKQIEGKLRKYYEQVALMEQKLDMDPTKRVKDYIKSISTKIGKPIDIVGFQRFAIGERMNEM